jgi:hypothetical protein
MAGAGPTLPATHLQRVFHPRPQTRRPAAGQRQTLVCGRRRHPAQFGVIDRTRSSGQATTTTPPRSADSYAGRSFNGGHFATSTELRTTTASAPCNGVLTRMIYVPGDLFPVAHYLPAACPAYSPQRARGVHR